MSPRKRKTTPEQAATRRIYKAEHVPDSIIADNKHNQHNTLTIRTSRCPLMIPFLDPKRLSK
jgi:hypothetical protein